MAGTARIRKSEIPPKLERRLRRYWKLIWRSNGDAKDHLRILARLIKR